MTRCLPGRAGDGQVTGARWPPGMPSRSALHALALSYAELVLDGPLKKGCRETLANPGNARGRTDGAGG